MRMHPMYSDCLNLCDYHTFMMDSLLLPCDTNLLNPKLRRYFGQENEHEKRDMGIKKSFLHFIMKPLQEGEE